MSNTKQLEEVSREHHQEKVERYRKIYELHAKKVDQGIIAREVGASRQTVNRYIHMDHLPERKQVETQEIAELKNFARGLQKDYDAVKAGLTLGWSNRQVEGYVHRLKLLKRQMYGKANFQTLRKRA